MGLMAHKHANLQSCRKWGKGLKSKNVIKSDCVLPETKQNRKISGQFFVVLLAQASFSSALAHMRLVQAKSNLKLLF